MEKELEFRKGVETKENIIKEGDIKIEVEEDIDVDSDEEKQKAENYFDNNSADKSGASDDNESEEEEESDDKPEEKSDDGDESDETKSDKEEEKTDGEADDSKDDEENKGKFDGYDTFEEYKVAMEKRLKANDFKSEEGVDDAEKNKNIVIDFFKKNSDVISQKTIDSYEKFFETGNNAFIHLDTDLYKIHKELDGLSEKLPLKEKLEKAFKLAFSDKIIKKEREKEKAITEVRAQKINKIASSPVKGGEGKSSKSYSSETQSIAKSWGIKL